MQARRIKPSVEYQIALVKVGIDTWIDASGEVVDIVVPWVMDGDGNEMDWTNPRMALVTHGDDGIADTFSQIVVDKLLVPNLCTVDQIDRVVNILEHCVDPATS